jgi:hypothetical protein
VAARIAEENADVGGFVHVASTAGEVALRMGLQMKDQLTRQMGEDIISDCMGMGGTLEAIGQVIQACMSSEIIKAK